MKITNVLTKVATAGLLAAAVAIASPKANAQVAFGVHIGGPVAVYGHVRPYYAPPAYGYYRPGFYGAYGYDRHLAWERHERFDRFHRGSWR